MEKIYTLDTQPSIRCESISIAIEEILKQYPLEDSSLFRNNMENLSTLNFIAQGSDKKVWETGHPDVILKTSRGQHDMKEIPDEIKLLYLPFVEFPLPKKIGLHSYGQFQVKILLHEFNDDDFEDINLQNLVQRTSCNRGLIHAMLEDYEKQITKLFLHGIRDNKIRPIGSQNWGCSPIDNKALIFDYGDIIIDKKEGEENEWL